MSEQLIQTPSTFGDNGNFLLERELGSGGMGGVYMGRDKMLDRPVAVKVMLKELGSDADFVEKFKKEAQSAAKLIHPNIAQIYSYGISDGMPYIAMELASGGSLYSLMNANPGKTDIARVIKICQQVAQALQCATDQGCVHGDVKPENVLLDASGNAKLVDFGLAAMQNDTNEIWGTPYYISPEKVRKEPIDFRADMYSLGGTLYHALTGVAPFEGEDSIAVVKKRFDGMPKKPSEIRPELTPAIDSLVMKMLALNKEDRYPSFEALIEAFKSVLTTGLTQPLPADVIGGKKMTTVRGRRTVVMRRRTSVTTSTESKPEGETEEPAETSETKTEAEEEKGGNLAFKVIGVIVGVVLVIGGIIGGLIWYKIADKNARAEEAQAQISGGIEKARSAIADTLSASLKFADEFDAFAAKAADECQKTSDELAKILPPEYADKLNPGPSKELLDAIAATNEVPVAVAAEAAVATTNSAATATNVVAAANVATNTTATTPPAVTPAPKAAPVAAASGQAEQTLSMIAELWNRAYGCQACAVRIRHRVRQIVAKGAEAEQITGESRENVERLAAISRAVVDMLDQVKVSKDVEDVKKGIAFIKSKGVNIVEQTAKRIRIEKLEQERKAKKEQQERQAAEAAAAAEAEKKAKIESETAAAKSTFEAIVAQGCFRQLDWKSAFRQLEALKSEVSTPEGQLAVDLEIRKVNAMKKVQDIFIKAMKGFSFKKSKLKGAKVTAINAQEIQFERNKSKSKLTWQKFYRDYFSNLIEALNNFVFNGRQNAKLSQRDVAEALTGGALTLRIVCSDEASAANLAEKLAKESVRQFPEYIDVAKQIFPNITFEASSEE